MNDFDSTIMSWKTIAESLGSKPLQGLIELAEGLIAQVQAGKERLAKAMEREGNLNAEKAKYAKLEAENAALKKQIEEMSDHPCVRDAKIARNAAEIKRLLAENNRLTPKTPEVEVPANEDAKPE